MHGAGSLACIISTKEADHILTNVVPGPSPYLVDLTAALIRFIRHPPKGRFTPVIQVSSFQF